MAYPIVINIPPAATVTYDYSNAIGYTIVSKGAGYFTGNGGLSGGSSDPAALVAAYIASAQDILARNQARIGYITGEITKLNQKISADPGATSVQAIQAQIAELQKESNDLKAVVASTGPAIASVQASGIANVNSVKETKAAEAKARETAKPTPTTPETPATANPAAVGNTKPGLAGAASDDSGAKQPNPAGTTGAPASAPPAGTNTPGSTTAQGGATTPAAGPSVPADPNASGASGYKYQASILSTQKVATASQPGKRLQNPLGEFSSYTYQLSLYMLTPDAYTAFVQSGRTKINVLTEASGGTAGGGAFIIAQSGGIGKNDKRAPGFDFDYGIDNLVIKHAVAGKATGSANNVTEITFNIVEPYGFSFLSNLRKANDALINYAKGLGNGQINPSRQFFVLGVRFLGYNAAGGVMQPNTKLSSGTGVVDPLSQTGSLFEYFVDISINQIAFKIAGKAVTYQVEATQTSQGKGLSTTKGFVQTNKEVTAGTVGEMLDQLLVKLNKEQDDLAKGSPPSLEIPSKYEIIWLPGTEDIFNASLVSPARIEKSRWAGSGAKTSAESNDATATKTQSATETKKNFTFPAGKSIVQSVNDVILQSSFMDDALTVLYNTDLVADPTTKSNPKQKSSATTSFKWYSCTPQVTEIKWDKLTKDWAYKISYLIQTYDTPALDLPFVAGGKPYPGPAKRYKYWFTGENQNIIKYEQTMDNTYYNTVLSAGDSVPDPATSPQTGDKDNKLGSGSQTPKAPNMQANEPRQGATGYGLAVQNSFMTSLYDPAAYASANITILGDPDFLTPEPSYSAEQVYDKYYGANGYSINANGGQVFIEVDFKEGVDYVSSGGTNKDGTTTAPGVMKINDSILFWQYPESIAKEIQGVAYQVITCDSTFVNGSFKQTLGCVIESFGESKQQIDAANAGASQVANDSTRDASSTASQFTGPMSVKDALTSVVSGTPTEKPVEKTAEKPTTPATPPVKPGDAAATPTNKDGKANDDGKSTNSPSTVPTAGREPPTG